MTERANQLARTRERQLEALRERTRGPERLVIPLTCAGSGQEFQATFTKVPPATRFTCEKVESRPPRTFGLGRVRGLFQRAEKPKTVPASEIHIGSQECQGCGSRQWTLCHRCEAFVCDSLSRPGYFVCHCGDEGATTPLLEVSGSEAGTQEGRHLALTRNATPKLLTGKRS